MHRKHQLANSSYVLDMGRIGLQNLKRKLLIIKKGPVAQRLEQGTHNPLVGGSNPSGPTKKQFSFDPDKAI